MVGVRTIQKSSLGFRFFSLPLPLLLIPVIALALGEIIAYAETPIGFFDSPLRKKGLSTFDQSQIYILGNVWHSIRHSEDQPTLRLTIQRKNAQSTISLQKPLLTKVIL